jgi:hypothetical protein
LGNGDGIVLHVIDVGTHTTVEEGGDEGLSGLSNDVVVEVLIESKYMRDNFVEKSGL